MTTGLHLSLSAESIYTIGSFHITNSIFTSLIVSFLLISWAFIVRSKLSNTTNKPNGLQNVAEFVVESLYGFIQNTTHDHKKTRTFLPFIGTFFLFILLNNWFGLLPGVGTIGFLHETKAKTEQHQSSEKTDKTDAPAGYNLTGHEPEAEILETPTAETTQTQEHPPASQKTDQKTHTTFVPLLRAGTADLNTTAALASISIIMVQLFGFAYLKMGYLTKYFNFESPIMFFVGILELISEFSKILSFAFRLFGNIFAGEVLLAVISLLAPMIIPMPFYGLELFVGFIQALVFSLLSLVFFNMATTSHQSH